MKKGTQAMLDAAKNDATLLPFDTVFSYGMVQIKRMAWNHDDTGSVYFVGVKDTDQMDCKFGMYLESKDLLPAKKSKPKKWQNGTQAQLDAAKDDARLIPKKTYFKSCYGSTRGLIVHRIDVVQNSSLNVAMWEPNGEFDFHNASDLEPIND